MEPKKETTRPIIEQLHEYVETRAKLLKLEVLDRSTNVIAGIVVDLVMIIMFILTFLFASFTLALFLGDVFGANWKGFGSVAIIYLLFAVIVIVARKAVQRPLVNILVRKLFN